MSREVSELLKKALELPPTDRAELAGSLIESLDHAEDESVKQFAEKGMVFAWRAGACDFLAPLCLGFPPPQPTARWVPPSLSLLYASLGINLAMRIRLHAAAAKRNIQSTRRRLRNFVFLSPATNLIHPKAFSTNFRLR